MLNLPSGPILNYANWRAQSYAVAELLENSQPLLQGRETMFWNYWKAEHQLSMLLSLLKEGVWTNQYILFSQVLWLDPALTSDTCLERETEHLYTLCFLGQPNFMYQACIYILNPNLVFEKCSYHTNIPSCILAKRHCGDKQHGKCLWFSKLDM